MSLSFTPVIGLEIHVQLATKTKLFCGCATDYIGAVPNTNVCPVCLGLPGTLPVLNAKAVEHAVRGSLALNCRVQLATRFHRKNYFYPDLPKAYQVSQYDLPVGVDGYLDIAVGGASKRIRIRRLHLEEDAGKLVHGASDGRLAGAAYSLADYNRAGVPLAEIVSEPDLATAQEAKEYVAAMRRLVRYLGISDGDMEAGSLRVDANISFKVSDGRWGDRVEVKNVNSLRALERAITWEIERQKRVLADNGIVVQETRHWDDGAGMTRSTRSKEDAHDYRYFPEPDLPALVIPEAQVEEARKSLPELPDAKRERFEKALGLAPEDAAVLAEERSLAAYFEAAVAAGASPVRAANWVRTEVLRVLNESGESIDAFAIAAKDLAELLRRVEEKTFSTTAARAVFETMRTEGLSIDEAAKKAGVSAGKADANALRAGVQAVLDANADVVAEISSGADTKGKKFKFLQGLVMRALRGQADAAEVEALLVSMLGVERQA